MLRKRRLVILITVLLVVGFVATALGSYQVSKDSLRREVINTGLPLTSDTIYSEIQNDLLPPIFVSSMMAHDTFLRDWALGGERDIEQVRRYLEEVQKKYDTVTSFFVSEKSRKYYHPLGVVEDVDQADPTDAWYFRVRKMVPVYEVNVDYDQANNFVLTVFINHKVFDYNGNLIGVAGVGLEVGKMLKRIEEIEIRYGRQIYFTDADGVITLAAGKSNADVKSIRAVPGLQDIAGDILSSPSGSYEYQVDGETILVNTRFISEFQWRLFVEQKEGLITGGVERALFLNLAVGLGVALVVVLLTNGAVSFYQGRLERLVTTDVLTGASNRRAFEILASQAIKEATRGGGDHAVMIMDLDHFKQINDRFGHLAGDEAIRETARIASATLRHSDVLCRWGGEEFAVWLKNCTLQDAEALAEKVRHAVETASFVLDGGATSLTTSIGVSAYAKGDDLDKLISRADAALYRAKDNGRNRVELG